MDFCTPHFGKTLSELTFEDVANFFQVEKIETDQLEFKSFGGTVNESYPGLIRTICAFLNSKGGLLIWGAPRGIEVSGRNEKIFQGDLTFISPTPSKDSIVSKCSDSIAPLPRGIRARIIEDTANKCVCIFEVDESDYGPHQYDKTYLMRIDGQTKPAPHHYVEALFRKIRYPNLEGYLRLNSIDLIKPDGRLTYRINFNLFFFNWSPFQNEENFSFRVLTVPGWFPESEVRPEFYTNDGSEFRRQDYAKVFHYGEPLLEENCWLLVDSVTLPQNNQVNIVLSIGGRYSPTKLSEYTLDLNTSKRWHKPNSIIVRKTENQLSKEQQDKKGITRESILKQILGD